VVSIEEITRLAKDYFPEAVRVRRRIHQHPELSFQEFETSKFIQSELQKAGIQFRAGLVKTGIVALIEGKNPHKRTILLRGDMDALPIQEKNEVPYCSQNPGVMHACGHDVHTTCVLGAAILLNKLKDKWEGTVKIMFQPGEELLPGGASLMVEEGVLQGPKVDYAMALHVFPAMETGMLGFKPGMYMASTDELYLTVKGKGGHAAMTADYINPLIIASEIILKVDETFMKPGTLKGTAGEKIPTVLAFGKIEGLGATNVIPDEVQLAGTCRTMNEQWRAEVHSMLQSIVKEISKKYGTESVLRIEKGYPFLVNDEKFTMSCMAAARDLIGNDNVQELDLRMTAEDFAFITQKVPSCFFRLGTGNKAKGISSGVHTATFDIDESALEIGVLTLAWLTLNVLNG
jgi:amidohydrolase